MKPEVDYATFTTTNVNKDVIGADRNPLEDRPEDVIRRRINNYVTLSLLI